MSKLTRQAQYRTPVDLRGPRGLPGASSGVSTTTTIVTTTVPVPVTTPFDPAEFVRMLVGYGRTLTGHGHVLWGPVRT